MKKDQYINGYQVITKNYFQHHTKKMVKQIQVMFVKGIIIDIERQSIFKGQYELIKDNVCSFWSNYRKGFMTSYMFDACLRFVDEIEKEAKQYKVTLQYPNDFNTVLEELQWIRNQLKICIKLYDIEWNKMLERHNVFM